ncbi:MAG: glycosyltransferase family 4 protein [Patescibacteria group bacterium]
MKIKALIFGWEFPPYNVGGLGVACKGLTYALCGFGVEIIFVLPKKMDVSADYMKIVFADAVMMKCTAINSLLLAYDTLNSYEESYRNNPLAAKYGRNLFEEVDFYGQKAYHIIKREKFDIIHAHDWLTIPAALLAKKMTAKPLVLHIHATEFDRSGDNGANPDVYEIEKRGMDAADVIIAVSNFTKNKIIKYYGIDPAKIRVVHNAAEDVSQSLGDTSILEDVYRLKAIGKKIVLYLGRITLHKGPDYFIRAAKLVLDRDPDVIFIVAGSGDMEHKIIELAAELGISGNMIFTGFLREEKLVKVYRAADLYVMPSVSEPFGITALEAMNYNTPVLVSRQSGVSEVITHALKVDFWDIQEMANKMLAVLEHRALAETLKENGWHDLEKISWKNSAQAVVNIYKELIK